MEGVWGRVPIGNSEREFALGILSEYLSKEWTGKVAKHLGVRSPEECTKENNTPMGVNIPTEYRPDPEQVKEDLSKKRKAEAALTTRGQQQLKKVNTKGMKSMMSFSRAKPKTKA